MSQTLLPVPDVALTDMQQPALAAITPAVLAEAIRRAMQEDLVHHAPLGYGGPHVYLYGTDRRSSVSIRNHSGHASLLITDPRGRFLFYGQMSPTVLGVDKVADHFHASLLAVQAFIL